MSATGNDVCGIIDSIHEAERPQNLRQQIEYCFKQATQGNRFSKGYCIEMLLKLITTQTRNSDVDSTTERTREQGVVEGTLYK